MDGNDDASSLVGLRTSSDGPPIAVAPAGPQGIVDAVVAGGGRLVGVDQADGLIWADPADAEGLKRALEQSPARWVQLPFAGIEGFVAAGAIDPGRTWTCAKGIYGRSCAEHALGFMIAAAHRFKTYFAATTWLGEDESSTDSTLAGTTVVIVGTGGIGGALAAMVKPLGMQAIGVNRSGKPLADAGRTVTVDRLGEVLEEADFSVIGTALTDETRGLFDVQMLGRIKRGGWLINVARGGVVVTDALVDSLRSGALGGAGLDVTDPEPLPDGHPLWDMANVMITPHVANTWNMGLAELTALVRRNVGHYAAGEALEAQVDPRLGY